MGSKKTAKADHRAKAPIDRKRFNGKIYVVNDEQKQMSDWLDKESFPLLLTKTTDMRMVISCRSPRIGYWGTYIDKSTGRVSATTIVMQVNNNCQSMSDVFHLVLTYKVTDTATSRLDE
jgi:hypothetical protein